jgi:hypothetical protein
MSLRSTTLALAAMMAFAVPAAAQGRREASTIPPGHRPPAGMCRIWLDDVPPGRQPEPMDCATARRWAPENSRVIYGSDEDERRDRLRMREQARRGGVARQEEDRDVRRDEMKRSSSRRDDSDVKLEEDLKRDTDRKRIEVKRDSQRGDPVLKRRTEAKRTAATGRRPPRVKR